MEGKDIRYKILSELNNALKWGGSGRIPKDEIRRRLKDQPIEGEVETLVKIGYVKEITKEFIGRPYFYLEITGRGIDFLEGRLQFQQIIVHGDHYTVSMGEKNSNVVIGRDNTQVEVQLGLNAEVGEAIAFVRDLARSRLSGKPTLDKVLHLLDSLESELGKETVDLDLIKNVKDDLLQHSGEVGAAISVLFGIPAIVDAINGGN